MNKDFPCDKARELLPFLEKLGISDLYASPVFRARLGSTHGYDVIDPSQANPELGGEQGFAGLTADLRARGMGLLLDIVPNHMAATSRNAWWTDVLESGASSAYSAFFDVEWDPAWERGEEKIFLPVLGSPYGAALENQELRLAFGEDGFSINYYQIHLPIDPGAYGLIFRNTACQEIQSEAFQAVLNSIGRLPGRGPTVWEGIEARRREIPNIKAQLWSVYQSEPEVRTLIDCTVDEFNGVKGEPPSFDRLDDLLSKQAYRLAWWHGARERMNYRRFFDVSELIGVRVENPEVFAATHQAVFRWLAEGKVTGLRIDHVDGLFKPREYLERLRSLQQNPYVVVEKILLGNETLPEDWPVEGTTGYDFLGMLDGVFIDGANLPALTNTYLRFTGLTWTFEDAAYEQQRWIINHLFRGEMFALSLHLELIADMDRYGRDLSPSELRPALSEVTACLPVYRTYLDGDVMTERDRAYIDIAVNRARRRTPDISSPVYDFLSRVLKIDFSRNIADEGRQAWVRFVMRWQQLTGPITAKGIEDTTLYVYNRLISMNEVGGQHGEVTLDRFHQFNAERQRRWPATMNASSTHDTKRSEDSRARINVLSEIPAEWDRYVFRWARWNRDKKTELDGRAVPDGNEEILLYQTLLGVWPLDESEEPSAIDRVKQYIVKATREAKVYSTWLKPNEPHEQATQRFFEAILAPDAGNRFRAHFLEFQARIAFFGAMNSLAATLVKITAPGIPDFYQNTELWDFSMVDPDNRRPVDVNARLRLAGILDANPPEDLLANWKNGRVKAYLIHKALEYRCHHPELFIEGEYIPLGAEGAHSGSVVAFARRRGTECTITVVPRFMTRLGSAARPPLGRRAWKDTQLHLPEEFGGPWVDAITGETRTGGALSEVLSTFPVALLTRP